MPEDENDDWTYDATWWHEDGDWHAECEDWSYDAGWTADAWHDDEGENFCVYGLHRAADDVEEILIDSGSKSTACRKDFAPHYGIDDTEKARLWDIQDQEIKSYGKKVVDVEFLGQGDSERLEARLLVDVSDVGKNIASMGRLLRAGFDARFTRERHRCWMERDGQVATIFQDDERSEAPLYYMRLRVLPVPQQREERRGLLVAPISGDEFHEGCEVEIAGLVRDQHLNGRAGVVVRRTEAGDRWVIKLAAAGGEASAVANVKADNLRRLDLPAAEVPSSSARLPTMPVQLRMPGSVPSKAVVESHNLAHAPAADWCEICIAAKSTANQHVEAEAKVVPMMQVDYQYMSADDAFAV